MLATLTGKMVLPPGPADVIIVTALALFGGFAGLAFARTRLGRMVGATLFMAGMVLLLFVVIPSIV